jgi:WW domain/Thrombospondin type 1 domain
VTGSYGTCSATCGGGVETRTVQCTDYQDNTVPDSQCDGSKPSASRSCNTGVCPTWFTGTYGTCSVSCGGGSQTRTVQCRDSNGVAVADSQCTGSKPAESQSCNTVACAGFGWSTGSFGTCSSSCNGGTQTRTVVCRDGSNQVVAESNCDSGSKPAASQPCNTEVCGAWRIGAYGICSVSCDGGTQSRTVICQDPSGNAIDENFCPAPKPPTSQACSTTPCPDYEWRSTVWGTCSKNCDGGTQGRTVQCFYIGAEPASIVVDSECVSRVGAKPSTTQVCNTQECPDPCIDADCGTNGHCVRDSNNSPKCRCEPGFTGSSCEARSQISNVRMVYEGDEAQDYVVLWQTVGIVPTVSIFLHKQQTSVPLAVASNIENADQFAFTSTEVFAVLGHGAYTVEVVYSSAIRNTSVVYNIDFCVLDIRCSGHGTCTNGKCACDDNYSGGFCGTYTAPPSPCDDVTCYNGGQCIVTGIAASCNCTGTGFVGTTCAEVEACAPNVCLYRGIASQDCQSCACFGNFTGTNCDTCSLSCNFGAPTADCTECLCGNTAYTGKSCNQKFRVLTIGPFKNLHTSSIGAYADLFNSQFEADIATALGIASSRIQMYSMSDGPKGLIVSFRLLALAESAYPSAVTDTVSLSQLIQLESAASADDDLDALVALVQALLLDTNSILYRGTITSSLIFGEAVADVPVAGESDSGVSPMIFIGVGIGAVVLIVAGVFFVRHRRKKNRADHQQQAMAAHHSPDVHNRTLPVINGPRVVSPASQQSHYNANDRVAMQQFQQPLPAQSTTANPYGMEGPGEGPDPRAGEVEGPSIDGPYYGTAQYNDTATVAPHPQQYGTHSRQFSTQSTTSLEPPLPSGWVEYVDEESGYPYFYNSSTGESSWDRPEL